MRKCEYGCDQSASFQLKNKRWCCSTSANGCSAVKARKVAAYVEKYGVTNPLKSKTIKEKLEQTNLERYGAKYIVMREGFKEEANATLMKNYGVSNPSLSPQVKARRKETFKRVFGTDHPSKSEEVKTKKRQTYQKKYGVDHYFSSDEFQTYLKQTLVERYGASNPGCIEEFRNKMIKTCIERYGLNRCKNVSNGEVVWLNENEVKHRQVAIVGASGKRYFVDGLKDNTVYEFLGIFWHGHPQHFNPDDINPVTKTTYRQLLERTKERLRDIEAAGYTVISIWETGEPFEYN